MTEELVLLNDRIIKKLLSGNTVALKKYVKEILEEVTEKKIKEEVKLVHPSIGMNKHIVNSEVDIVYETKDTYYNIEINKDYSKKLDKKNLAYLHQLSLRSIKKSKEYIKGKKVIQINLDNYDRFKEGKFIYKTSLMEENIYVKRNEEIEIYDVNLDYLKYVAYNDIKKDKLARLLYLLVETDEEKIKKIYEGDELLMDVKKEAERIMENFDALLYYDPYELGKEVGMDKGIDIGRDEGISIGRDEGISIGRDEGISIGRNEAKAETAYNLVKAGIDLGVISKATNISIQDLQEMRRKEDINANGYFNSK